ncbi:MAG: aminopeptidase [Pseudomonadota bacterium]
MKLADFGTLYSKQLENLEKLAGEKTLWHEEAKYVQTRAGRNYADVDEFLQLLHEMQRMSKIQVAGLGNDEAFRVTAMKARVDKQTPFWKEFGSPPVDLELQRSLAEKLYNIRPGKNDVGSISVGEGAREIGKMLAKKCLAEKVPFIVNFSDASFNALVLNHTTEEGVKRLAAAYVEMYKPVTRDMSARPGMPEVEDIRPDVPKIQLYSREVKPFSDRISSGDLFYTLTVVPTRKDAELDGIEYNEYLKLFFEACDQPWGEINKAQKNLIEEFNAASTLHITNSDGTDITMSLVDKDGSKFTFCNSLTLKNVPGSEMFSAPRLDSVEGVVVAKGSFMTKDNRIVENLTLKFEKGRLVDYTAGKGLDAFKDAIGVDEGANWVGELGIGTNPHLKRHVVNGLLVEKIGGSFHLALGRPYAYTEYGDEPVKVNNGGTSALHWDITTMLRGKEGRIYLDDRLVMDNGKWLDNKYDVLNRGWESIPEEKRPDYWKGYYKPKPPSM